MSGEAINRGQDAKARRTDSATGQGLAFEFTETGFCSGSYKITPDKMIANKIVVSSSGFAYVNQTLCLRNFKT